MMKKELIVQIAKYLFALHLIIFGANKFLLFANFPPPTDETAQLFMGGMFGTYLAKLVGLVEIIGGILLLIPKTSFIGFLMLLPVVANIVMYHIAHDMPGNGIWLFTLALSLIIAFGEKEQFVALAN